jgi:hypothetical protein
MVAAVIQSNVFCIPHRLWEVCLGRQDAGVDIETKEQAQSGRLEAHRRFVWGTEGLSYNYEDDLRLSRCLGAFSASY